jgi:hypothetical protein
VERSGIPSRSVSNEDWRKMHGRAGQSVHAGASRRKLHNRLAVLSNVGM